MTHGLGCRGDCATCQGTRGMLAESGGRLLDELADVIELPAWQHRSGEPLDECERRRAELLDDVARRRELLGDVQRERFGGNR